MNAAEVALPLLREVLAGLLLQLGPEQLRHYGH